MTPAERARNYRVRKGAGDRRGPVVSHPCPSWQCHQRRQRAGLEVHPVCRQLYNEYINSMRRR